MVQESFYLKLSRLTELKEYVAENMPSCKLPNSYYAINGSVYITITYEIEDMNKMSELHNKWYTIDNPTQIPKLTFLQKIKNKISKWLSKKVQV